MKITSFMNQLKQSFTKKGFALVAVMVMLLGMSFGAIQAEFYPDRPTFDYNTEAGRQGSTTGPVFNSFINTPSYGDERSFLDARRTDQTAAGSYKNVLPDVDGGAKEVVIRAYIHNNANTSLNGVNFDGIGVAKNTKIKIDLPEATGNVLRARAGIYADNATTVEDTVDFTAPVNFHMEYVKGSATLYNNGVFKNGTTLSDSIVDSGAPIGYSALNGIFPGCFDYEATVQIRVKIVPNTIPGMDFKKEVRLKGDKTWAKEVSAKPGQNVEWLLTNNNKGASALDNIVVQDVLPPHVQLVPGSVRRINSNDTAVQTDKPLFNGGINVGTYNAGAGFYIMFETTTRNDFEPCTIRVRNQAYARSTQTTEIGDTADLTITKENCNTTVASYSCDLFTVSKSTVLVNEKFQATVKYSAKDGATFKLATFTFGDEKSDKDKQVVNASTNNAITVDHAYATSGSKSLSVKLDFDVNGQTKTVDGTCVAVVKVNTTTPPKLPDTGAGNTIAVFLGATFIGAFLYRMRVLRSLN